MTRKHAAILAVALGLAAAGGVYAATSDSATDVEPAAVTTTSPATTPAGDGLDLERRAEELDRLQASLERAVAEVPEAPAPVAVPVARRAAPAAAPQRVIVQTVPRGDDDELEDDERGDEDHGEDHEDDDERGGDDD